ncbi:Uncharacterised protein [Streptococcus pneumoniae]|nr:Uncharacterised protein [Streptococcus pneumoniae]
MSCHTIDKVTIMTDKKQGTIKVNQSIFQHFLAINIQVVGRLVKDQEVVVFHRQFS